MKVNILGAIGEISSVEDTLSKVKEFESRHGVKVQLIRADRVFGPLHLEVAVEHAQRRFEHGRNRSNDIGIELLLYTAAERQISVAIEKLGIRDGTEKVAIVIVGEAPEEELLSILGLERNDDVLAAEPDQSYSVFGISTEEVEAIGNDRVSDLILERMALSELYR